MYDKPKKNAEGILKIVSMLGEGNDFPEVINLDIALSVIWRLLRVVMILLIDKYTKSIFLSQVLAVLEEEEDINEVQLKRIDQKLYELPVNLPTLKIECKFFF